MKLTEKQLKTIIKESVKRTMIEEGFFGDMKDKFQQKFKMGDYKEVEGFEERLKEYEELREKLDALLWGHNSYKGFTFKTFLNFFYYFYNKRERGFKIYLDGIIYNHSGKMDYFLEKQRLSEPYIKNLQEFVHNTRKYFYKEVGETISVFTFKRMEHKNSKKVRDILEEKIKNYERLISKAENCIATMKKVIESVKRLKSMDSLLKNLPKYHQALENSI